MIEQPTFAPATDRLRRAYGFDEVALVPGAVTLDPAEVDLTVEIGGHRLEIPFLASAMDAVADVDFAVRLSRHGGVAFINLEGLYTRYEDATPIIERVAGAETGRAAAHLLAEAYNAPVRPDLISALITRVKAQGAIAAVATTPAAAWDHAEIAAAAGADLFLVQSQVSSARHISTSGPRAVAQRPDRCAAPPGPGRQHGERRGRLPAHAAGRGRHPCRGRPRRGVHHAGGAGHRRATGQRDPGGGGGARSVSQPTPGVTSRSSPMAA